MPRNSVLRSPRRVGWVRPWLLGLVGWVGWESRNGWDCFQELTNILDFGCLVCLN